MAGGRTGPALFELIRDKTGTAGTSQQQASSVPISAPRPAVAPDQEVEALPPPPPPRIVSTTHETPPERPKAWVTERENPSVDLSRPIPVTTSMLWLAVAGVLVSWIIVWTAAWKISERQADARAAKEFNSAGGVHDPLNKANEPIPVNPNLIARESPKTNAAPPQAPTGENKRQAAAPAPSPSAAPPPLGTDPRTPGLNYYVLATKVDGEIAQQMVEFLTRNGVPAFAVSVAKGGGGANNHGPYTVYASSGITREMLRARAPERTELEDKVRQLGKAWQKEHKGQGDFATAWWEKYGS